MPAVTCSALPKEQKPPSVHNQRSLRPSMTACGHAWRLWDRLGRLHLLAALVLGRFLDNAAVWAAKDMPEGAQALGTEVRNESSVLCLPCRLMTCLSVGT